MPEPSDFEAVSGLTFTDHSLLQRALTHRSYLNEHPEFALEDNERLEFLGDAVLDFFIGEYLYHRFPEMREGRLTSLRAALVCEETLARFARQLNLGDYLLMGHGEAESGGRERPAVLCATFEALIGALYLDQGMKAVSEFVLRLVEPEAARILAYDLDKDPKSLLQELSQGELQLTPTYRTMAVRGPDHAREFTVEALIGGRVYGRGVGRSKRTAAQEAARQALRALQEELRRNCEEAARAGNGLTSSLPDDLRRALHFVLDRLTELEIPWALSGSAALLLNGVQVAVHDLDLTTDESGVQAIANALAEFIVTPAGWWETEKFASQFARLQVEGVQVDVVGRPFIIKRPEGVVAIQAWSIHDEIDFEGRKLPVIPLEAQLIAYAMMGREAKVQLIVNHLRTRGFNQELWRELIAGQNLPPDTVQELGAMLL
ncbi:MAG: ribonuclease III [Anaerolineae bacterium]|jgi:ribonuclease-3|nr:ribonuclease III [Anaerolineae bacterium]MDH7473000.1 ribonuclease III [Anaerolineae bacterium]